jgi:mono/diheme cytochrome c family protein
VPPLSGGTLTLLRDGRTAVAADPDRDRIFITDLTELAVVADLPLDAGDEPGRSVEDETGAVHVILRRAGALLTLRSNAGTWTTVARRPICAAPRGIAYDVREDLLHVACAEGLLVSLPAAGGEPVRVLTLPLDLRDVVVSDGNLYVSRFRSAEVLVIGRAGQVTRQTLPPLDEMGNHSTPAVAWRMRPYRDGQALVVHQVELEGVVRTIAGGYGGNSTTCAQLMESAVSAVRPDGSTVRLARLRSTVLPIDVAFAPERQELAVVAAGAAHTARSSQIFLAGTDGPPVTTCTGSERSGNSEAQPHGEAVAVEFTPAGQLLVQTREPAALELPGTGKSIRLSSESRVDAGHAIFHSTAGALLACASCHPEGGEDGHVWTFDVGARRTQSLRGGISGGAPFHWNGDLPSLGQLYDEVYTRRMAGPKLDEPRQRALTRFIDGIPTLPAAEPGEAAERGKLLFTSAGCVACHGGTARTNNLTVDVGTGGSFQTPSLNGVRWRAPYLHDGCAATLTDRFGACGSDRHGITSSLSAAQIADLVAYLETL